MTRSKLSWLHGLFGDDIPTTRQHFVLSEKHVIFFFVQITWFWTPLWFRYEVWICRMISMKISFHVWNLILFKGQKYHQGSLANFIFCSVKGQSRTVLSSVLLFLCVTCDLTCGLWSVTCDLHFGPAPVLLMKFAFIVTFEEFFVLYSEQSFYKCLINLSCRAGRCYRRK